MASNKTMRIIHSKYMDLIPKAPADEDTIQVKPKELRSETASNTTAPAAPTSPATDAMDTKITAAQIADQVKELVRSDSDVSDFDLSELHNTTLDMGNSFSFLRSGGASDEPPVKNEDGSSRPLTPLDETMVDESTTSSLLSSPLSSLSRTPTPPPEFRLCSPASASSSKPSLFPNLKIKQESPAPIPKRLSQPPRISINVNKPTANTLASTTSQVSQPTRRRLRTVDYVVECTHSGMCSCHSHAGHPSVRQKPVRGHPHFSEWALGLMEWPESAERSSIQRERESMREQEGGSR